MQIPYVVAGDRLQPRVDVRDLLLAVLALARTRGCTHRPRAVERDERDQVVELRRLHLAQRVAHARALELEDAGRLAAREHRVGLACRRAGSRRCRGRRRSARPPCRSRRGCAGRGSRSSAGRAPRRRSSRTASRPPGRRPSAAAARRSISGSAPITTPAAWIESARVSPSSGRARSTISFAIGSASIGACAAPRPA